MDHTELFDASDRRSFFKKFGRAGLGLAAAATLGREGLKAQQPAGNFRFDTPTEIFTAALIAEDLATTFYYNGLVGNTIQDPRLAGPGGSVSNITSAGDANNVSYIQAALGEEFGHANLMRQLLEQGTSAATDPVQTFYFPTGSFDSGDPFLKLLDTLENAFIGAYLLAIRGFAFMSALLVNGSVAGYSLNGVAYSTAQLQYYGEVAASIMGVECEHRVLGRDIAGIAPANNVCYEQTDGLNAVFNGPASAVAALTPFLAPGTGLTGFSLATAVANVAKVSLPCTGGIPAA